MKKEHILLVVILVAILAATLYGIYYALRPNNSEAHVTPPTNSVAAQQTQNFDTTEREPKGLQTTVTYDNKTFTPSTVTIKAGATVLFDNTSEVPMWPASDAHPTHTLYPEFDMARANANTLPEPGQDFSFTFTKTGAWKYHDHNFPDITGTIMVE